MAFPQYKPKNESSRSGLLTENETDFILRSKLLREHFEDVNILKFIRSYLVCRSVSQASKEAGLDNARSGNALLQRADIYEAIIAIDKKSVYKMGFDATEVVARINEIAQVDIADIFNENGTILRPKQMPRELSRTIKKFEVVETFTKDENGISQWSGYVCKVEFHDKMKANELLGREKNLFVEKKVVTHEIGKNAAQVLLDQTSRADKRLAEIDVTPTTPMIEHKNE